MNKKAARYVLIIVGSLLAIVGIVMIAATEYTAIAAVAIAFGVVGGACGVFMLLSDKKKLGNAHSLEATFLNIDPRSGQYASLCYFEADGKQIKIAIPTEVFRGERLAPGAKYRVTLDPKEEAKGSNFAIKVERIG